MTTEQNTPGSPAVGTPDHWQVRAHDPERVAFEAWLNPGRHAGNVSPFVEPGHYEKETHPLAWLAWQAARPKRAAVGTLINIAAELAQRKPVRALDILSERSGRTLGRSSMDDAIEAAHDRLAQIACRIVAAARAL